MTDFQVASVLLVLAAALAYVNAKLLRLPAAIGMMAIALVGSLVIVGLDAAGVHAVADRVESLLHSIQLGDALLHGMLGLMLFAGALHVDLAELREQKWPIATLALVGTLISTALLATALYGCTLVLDLPLSFVECLLFGALISPTDPIAVLGILRSANAPRPLEVTITGESLFNDGVGVVVFLAVLGIATGGDVTAGSIGTLFVREAIGGAVYGLAVGYVGFRLLRSIDDYSVEILITLAMVFGGYAGAEALHLSAPIAAVVSGLLIGNHGRRLAMSDTTRQHIDSFWELIDHVLNAILFLILGLEVVRLPVTADIAVVAAMMVPLVLIARLTAVAVPIVAMPSFRRGSPGALVVLTWGGLRGGLSVALALSLPAGAARDTILVVTYAVVVFSVLIQGMTLGAVTRRATRRG